MRKKKTTGLLTKEEEYELVKRAREGDESAFKELISSNMGLVIKIASDSVRRIGIRSSVISFEDVVSAGVEGLIEGINRFDASKGYRLSTYAYWWIKNHVRRFIITNMPFGSVSIRTAERSFKDPGFASVTQTPLSLNDDENPIDIPDDTEKDEFEADRKRVRDTIIEALQKSKRLPKDRDFCIKLLSLRYGLDTGVPLTLRETGEILGVSAEHVRQIEKELLKILRRNRKIKSLKEVIS
jgi:RNA polymerase primary sigma factor